MDTTEMLLETHVGSVAKLTMNRPGARNSLSLEMLECMFRAIQDLSVNSNIHVIILAANGPGFCAGHDLKELKMMRTQPDKGRTFYEETMDKCARLMQAIVTCPKPVIAQVHGIATAAGCQLVASCDLAIATDTARFATPGVNIGLFCSTPMVALSRNVGRKSSMKMLLTGDLISADEARAIGLINDIVPENRLAVETEALAQQIAGKAPTTLKIGKEAFYKQIEMTLSEAYHYTSEVMVTNMLESDAEEGIAAFIEKRTPNWQPLKGE
ncbi:enoyl-CoA hydratase [Kiloniella spongiae]|uniref:Enoyl-CoA hydratase domain-containing protein 3, mitochondrial n=1 Tax=Kiloniella spongiae TaxID=1489064 RepID=A0A0H2MA54_9PROT|nr:enoyl-CoA hydratase [Kiloniella spongiae]KLN59051.1 enoyl-CoA hydratase [Kiloniella spongiae]